MLKLGASPRVSGLKKKGFSSLLLSVSELEIKISVTYVQPILQVTQGESCKKKITDGKLTLL